MALCEKQFPLNMVDLAEEMNRRVEAGEFGNPVDIRKMNEAWAELVEKSTNKWNEICGLWRPKDRLGNVREDSKVFGENYIKEEIVIPAHSKIIAFKVSSDNENAPVLNLVWTRD